MAVDMKWRDAMAVRCIAQQFTKEAQQAGWPQMMGPEQLAALQRPYVHDDPQGRRSMHALRAALEVACEEQSLPSEAETRSVVVVSAVNRVWVERRWEGDVHRRDTRPAQYEDRTFYRIAPADFSVWLAMQEMEPSQHIAAWFKVCGVAATGKEASAQAAPALQAADVVDWPSLVRYRQQFSSLAPQKRPSWLDGHVRLLAGQLQAECVAGKSRGALARLGEELGGTRQALEGLLERHGYDKQSGKQAQTAANPFGVARRRKTG